MLTATATAAAAMAAPVHAGVAAAVDQALRQALQAAVVDPSPSTLALVVAIVSLAPFLVFVPMTLVFLGTARLLPAALSAPVIMAAVIINTAAAWILARTVFGARVERWLERRGGAWGAILRAGARRSPLQWSFLSRYIPAPFMAAPMILASTGAGLGVTVLGSALGMAPWVGVYIWVVHAGREGSLGAIGQALAGLVLLYLLAAWLRRRVLAKAKAPVTEPLTPRAPDRPVVTLYTLAGHDLSDEARLELAALRERLGFEVQEVRLDASADPALVGRHQNHAPVAFFDGHQLFNFQMDENVLTVRLRQWRERQGAV